MRILHTSDWHLGRSFHRVSLLDAQAAYLDHLVRTVREHAVDVVVVAGDVYDRAVPPLAAVQLFDDALHRLAAAGVPTVMISGNHDSARRLGVGAGLIARAGIHLRTDPGACATPVVLHGAQGDVAFYGLPYLEPALVRDSLGAPRTSHEAVLTAAMDQVRADLAARPDGTRSVVLAHAFVAGGEPSDSERDITVGGVAAVPAGVFAGVDYVALGHLHGCQTVTERVRYSGSPLAYSFSEHTHRKTMWLIDLGPGERWPRSASTARCRARSYGSGGTSARSWRTRPWNGTGSPGWRPPSPTRRGRTSRWPASPSASRTPSAWSSTRSVPRRTPPLRTPSGWRDVTTTRWRRTSWPMYAAETVPAHRSGQCCAPSSTTYG